MTWSIGARAGQAAQSWVGTPFVWGQSTKGRGCDCKGLVLGVATDLGRPEAASFYGAFAAYRRDRKVPSALLLEGMAALFDPVDLLADRLRDGDVLVLTVDKRPQHLAIVAGGGLRAVHADGSSGRIRERRLAALIQMFPLHSAWRWRRLGKGSAA